MALEHTEAHTPAVEENQNSGKMVCTNVEKILSGVQKLFEMVPLEGTLPKGPSIPRFTFQATVRNYLERGSTMTENQQIYIRQVPGGMLETERNRMILIAQRRILEEISDAGRTPITVSEQTPVILTLSRIA